MQITAWGVRVWQVKLFALPAPLTEMKADGASASHMEISAPKHTTGVSERMKRETTTAVIKETDHRIVTDQGPATQALWQ